MKVEETPAMADDTVEAARHDVLRRIRQGRTERDTPAVLTRDEALLDALIAAVRPSLILIGFFGAYHLYVNTSMDEAKRKWREENILYADDDFEPVGLIVAREMTGPEFRVYDIWKP